MVIKRNIVFELENRKFDGNLISENVPIRLRVVYSGKRIELSTGFRIDREKWDDKKKKVKNNCFNKIKQSSSDINAKLSDYESELQNIFKKFELEERIPDKEEIKYLFHNAFSENSKQSREKNFFEYLEEYVRETSKLRNWKPNTTVKFVTVEAHLKTFNPRVSFSYFDEKGLTAYVDYLQNTRKMRNSSVSKQIDHLKWFLKWAKQKGYNKNLSYETFKPKLKSAPSKIIFLTQDELTKIKTVEIPAEKRYLDRVRDLFLFLCYSGIRYSDIQNLKKTDIKGDYFEITTIKTGANLLIELNKHTKSILKKYEHIPYKDDKALPVITNQKMIDYLRELAELAKIDEPIRQTYYKGNERVDKVVPKYKLLATHTGRRTFICTALSLGIPVNVVMKWTGHSDYKAMKPYIDIADDIKANAMKKFDLV